MKYEVIRRFRDKYTGEIILPGSAFICEETDRIKDLTDRGIIKKNVPIEKKGGEPNVGGNKAKPTNQKRKS